MKAKLALCLCGLLVLGPFAARFASAERPALAFIHGEDRVEIPERGVVRLEAVATVRSLDREIGIEMELKTSQAEICLADEYRLKLCELSKRMSGHRIQTIAGCRVLSRGVVLGTLCTEPCHYIGRFNSVEDAAHFVRVVREAMKLKCTTVASRANS